MSDTELPLSEGDIRAALEARRGDWNAIKDAAGVSHSWLSKFVNGRIPGPRTTTLRKVRDAIAANDEAKARA